LDKNINILLVEDNPGDIFLIREMFKEMYVSPDNLLVATRVSEAIRPEIIEKKIALILLDLSLPDSEGMNTIRVIRAHFPESAIVVLTGLSDEKTALMALREGAQNYHTKDEINSKVLERTLHYSIERHNILSNLRIAHERLLFHIENTPLGFMEWDGELKIRSLSKRAEEIFGWSMKEFLESGSTFYTQVYEEDRIWVSEIADQMLSGKLERNKTLYRNYSKDGRVIWCEWFNSVMKDKDGKVNTIMSLVQDVTERKEAEKEILKMNEQLRDLSSHLQNIREEERKHIAREIHDELGQQLTGMKMDLAMIRQDCAASKPVSEQSISEVMSMVDDAIKTVRKISSELRPSVIDDLGLLPALNWQSHEFEKRYGIPCSFVSSVKELPFEKDFVTGLFRIYQESLTNIARHAKASEISSSLSQEDNSLVLKIKDNGIGFNPDTLQKKTLGIIGMKERAFMLGGEFNIDSNAVQGTSVTVRIPIRLNTTS
jgi:two-component system sensor histidine kinase UhpB